MRNHQSTSCIPVGVLVGPNIAIPTLKIYTLFWILLALSTYLGHSQTTSSAIASSGSGYSVLKNDGFAIEDPDCKHRSFGSHITQKFDNELQKNVFIFHSHINEDNDRCKKDDRVRIEIKGGPGASSNELRHPKNTTSYYRWKFRLGDTFKGSSGFCHIFQLKAKGGNDDGFPVLTITPRSSTLQFIHNGGDSGKDLGKVEEVSLAGFKGEWVEGYMKIKHSENGSVTLTLKKVSNGQTLLSYSKSNIDLWRSGADYNRPKWGIYRKKVSGLKDEQIRFADWCISESSQSKCPSSIGSPTSNKKPTVSFENPTGNLTVQKGYQLSIRANAKASGTNGKIQNVKLYIGKKFIRQELKAPYTWGVPNSNTSNELNGLPVGKHIFKVVATDTRGATATDSFVLTVKSSTTPNPNPGSSSCAFNTPASKGIKAKNKVVYNQVHIVGNEGPSLKNFKKFTINWVPNANGLYQFAINTTNGSPDWYVDFKKKMSFQLKNAKPEVTLKNTGIANLDGSYWVAETATSLILVSKTKDAAIHFSTTATPPSCGKKFTIIGTNNPFIIATNPFDDQLIITNIDANAIQVKVFDQNGKSIWNSAIDKNTNELVIKTTHFSKGMYFVKILYDGEASQLVKAIKF